MILERTLILSVFEDPLDPQQVSSEQQAALPTESIPPPEVPPAPLPPHSAENPVFTGWDVLQVAGLTLLLALFVVPLITVTVARAFFYTRLHWLDVAQKPAVALVSQFIAYIIVALFMVLLIHGKYHVSFWQAVKWNWPGIAGLSLVGIGVLMLSFDFLAKFLPMPQNTPFDQFFDRPFDAYLTAIFAVTFGPLMEELFFRGMLYPVLARRIGVLGGIFITASLFGLMHFAQYGRSWGAVLIIFLVGVVLTTIRAVTKSVASSFLAHVGYNGTLMLLAAAATGGFKHMEKASLLLAR
jgi:uncharacterized protein